MPSIQRIDPILSISEWSFVLLVENEKHKAQQRIS
jgi:hypothetical protein